MDIQKENPSPVSLGFSPRLPFAVSAYNVKFGVCKGTGGLDTKYPGSFLEKALAW